VILLCTQYKCTSHASSYSLLSYADDYEIVFKKTDDHGNADMLSRLPLEDKDLKFDGLISSIEEEIRTVPAEPIEKLPVSFKLQQATRQVVRQMQQGWKTPSSARRFPALLQEAGRVRGSVLGIQSRGSREAAEKNSQDAARSSRRNLKDEVTGEDALLVA
jgi:hypothetical protein